MDNKKIWDENWAKIAAYSTNSAGNRWAFYLIKKILRDITIGEGIIIDVGCGMGNKTAELAKRFPDNHVIGMDFSKEGLDFASNYYRSIKNLSFKYGDATQNEDKPNNNRIEMVSSFEVLEHIKNWKDFLYVLCKMSDQYVLLSTPTGKMRSYEKQIGHYRNFRKGEIEHFMKVHGYRRVKVLYAGFPFWSPLTRDFFDLHAKMMKIRKDSNKSELVATCNPFIHGLFYILYRYLSFDRKGDQFIGLFKKVKSNNQ